MTVTSVPVGTTGQSLEGWEVNGAVRESVTLTDPTNPDGAAEIVSTQPIAAYGLPVWLMGQPSVNVGGTVAVQGAVSSQIVSSIPFYVAQSSAPWTMNGAVAVTNTPTVNVTNVPAVNITSSLPFLIAGTTMVNIVSTVPQSTIITSSIPFYVAQSSAPWLVNGAVSVSNTANVSVAAHPAVFGTVSSQIVSSIPIYVNQSSAPWSFIETYSTNAGALATSVVLLATLNTTVVKAARGNLYSYQVSNFASTSLYVKLANASTATIASTAPFLWRIGVAPSTTVHGTLDVPINFSTGICMFTTRNGWNQDLTAPLGSTAVVNIEYF